MAAPCAKLRSGNTPRFAILRGAHWPASARTQRLAELTERECDVMGLVIEGRPNKLIADTLDISVPTVEVHRARLFEKMEVKSAVEFANLLRDVEPR